MSVTANWNPWHGCHKKSEGCANCYVYRIDEKHGRDSTIVKKTAEFDLPLRRDRQGNYKIKSGDIVWTCFSSDFLVEEADQWRDDAWRMISERHDLHFLFITKRPERLLHTLPSDWGNGYDNVTICCTVENQRRANERMPIYIQLPIKRKIVCCEPLLEAVDLTKWLGSWISHVVVGGESGTEARVCNYAWVLALREQCDNAGIGFYFKQTGAKLLKNGKLYAIKRKYQHLQAKKAGINTTDMV